MGPTWQATPARCLVAPRDRINRPRFAALLVLLATVFVLLRFGDPDGLTDQIGVVAAIGLWFLLPHTLNSWNLVRD